MAKKNTKSQAPAGETMSMEQALAALIKRNEELVTLSKSKDEFIAITSHQLRTPATGVKQYLGLLLQGYAEPLTKSQTIFLQKAYENNERQLRIVDDILRVAQLDLDKIRLELAYIDVGEIVESSIAALKDVFDARKQKTKFIRPDAHVVVKIDPEQFRMVIDNLLENASNYSPAGKIISVRIGTLKNGSVRVAVRDNGVGIAAKDLPKLFQKFSRINNPLSNSTSGTGLGLYYSKKIIELHKGRIGVHSTVGKGTTFTVTLPH